MDVSGLITLVLVIAVIGFCIWLITTYIPMPAPMKTAIIVLVIVVMVLWVLRALVGGGLGLKLGG
jgi:hypothetical protein